MVSLLHKGSKIENYDHTFVWTRSFQSEVVIYDPGICARMSTLFATIIDKTTSLVFHPNSKETEVAE